MDFRSRVGTNVTITLVTLAIIGANPVWAEHFKKLSDDHINSGVSQFNYGLLGRSERDTRFINPSHVTQAVASIVYTRANAPDTNTAVFLGCSVEVLAPHVAIGGERFDTPDVRAYVESVWAPVDKVSVRNDDRSKKGSKKHSKKHSSKKGGKRSHKDDVILTRLADGLGGRSAFGFGGNNYLGHPDLFSLPSDDIVPGQQQTAIDCVVSRVTALGLPSDIFSDFGLH